MAEKGFIVKNATADDIDAVSRVLATVFQKLFLAPYEMASTLLIDSSALYFGRLNGDCISSLAALKYPGHSTFVSSFAVLEEHRGKGYGKKTWDTAWRSIDMQCTVGLDAGSHLVSMYESLGFRSVWNTVMAFLDPKKMNARLSNFTYAPTIRPINSVDVKELAAYDASVFGTSREKFLEKWTRSLGTQGWVVAKEPSGIAGYIVVRKVTASAAGHAHMIGPLYADDDETAKGLLKAAAETIFEKGSITEGGDNRLVIMCSDGGEYGDHGLQLIAGMEASTPYVIGPRMYTSGVPAGRQPRKVYGTTSIIFD